MYRLDLLVKMKIYLVQYITILELAYRDLQLLIYKIDTYRGQEKKNNYLRKLLVMKKLIIKYGTKYYGKATEKLYRN